MYVTNNLRCNFQQCPWEIGWVWAERVGQGKLVWYKHPKSDGCVWVWL